MRRLILWTALVFIAVGPLLGCQASATPLDNAVEEQCRDFKMVTVSSPSGSAQVRDVFTNHSHSYEATIVCLPFPDDPSQCQESIYVQNNENGQTAELTAECFLPWRPFSNLAWASDNVLVFDQWANPNYGHHFAVEIVNGSLLEAWAFNDENHPTSIK